MRLIDADIAKKDADERGNEFFLTSFDCYELNRFLDEQPIADAEPVRHGKWEERGRYYICSNCGDTIASLLEMEHCAGRKWDYCPCCGAKMDEE